MHGFLVLNGGQAFTSKNKATDGLWLKLVRGTHNPRVAVLPTAAIEKHGKQANDVAAYFGHLRAFSEAKQIIDPLTANTRSEFEVLDKVEAIVLTDGSPIDLIERLRGTQTEACLRRALWERRAAVMAAGASAMALCRAFWFADAWEPGLALVPDLAILPHHNFVRMRLEPARLLADLPEGVTLIGIDQGATLVRYPDDSYQVLGEGTVTVYRSADQLDEYPAEATFRLDLPGAD